MTPGLEQKINDEMIKLPAFHQHAIKSLDWKGICQEIGDRHNLLDAEISGLQAEVALVLMGLSDLRTLHRYIDDEIAGTGWQEIEASVVNDIIRPIADTLERTSPERTLFSDEKARVTSRTVRIAGATYPVSALAGSIGPFLVPNLGFIGDILQWGDWYVAVNFTDGREHKAYWASKDQAASFATALKSVMS